MREKLGGYCIDWDGNSPALPEIRKCQCERLNDKHYLEVEYDDAGVVQDYKYYSFGETFFYHLLPAALRLADMLLALKKVRWDELQDVERALDRVQLTIDLERGNDPTKETGDE